MKERIDWIDCLRGIAMFFVILGHAFNDKNNIIRKYIYSFHMPLFFFVSGLTYKEKDIKFKDFIINKAKKLLIPYLALNFFTILIKFILNITLNMYNNISVTKTIKAFFTGIGNNVPCVQSWFLLTLFLTEIIFYLLKKITKNDKNLFISIIILSTISFIYSISDFHIILFWHLDTSFIALLYYFAGYFFMKKTEILSKILSKKYISILIFILSILAGAILENMNSKISMNSCNYGNTAIFLASSCGTILALVIISIIISKRDFLFRQVGIASMFYLGYHSFLLAIIKKFIPALLNNNFYTIIIAIVDLIILYPISKNVYKKTPILVGKI